MAQFKGSSLNLRFFRPQQESTKDSSAREHTTPANTQKTNNRTPTEKQEKSKKMNKLGHLEELDRMIEERLKKSTANPRPNVTNAEHGPKINPSPTKRNAPPNAPSKKEPEKKKDSKMMLTLKNIKENETNRPAQIVSKKSEKLIFNGKSSSISSFSLDKVLGLCRTKLHNMDSRREELLASIGMKEAKLEEETKKLENFQKLRSTGSVMSSDASPSMASPDFPDSQKPSVSTSGIETARAVSSFHKQQPKTSVNSLKVAANRPNNNNTPLQINEILKNHAQRLSSHSIKAKSVKKPEPEKKVVDKKKLLKIIEIKNRANELQKQDSDDENDSTDERKEEKNKEDKIVENKNETPKEKINVSQPKVLSFTQRLLTSQPKTIREELMTAPALINTHAVENLIQTEELNQKKSNVTLPAIMPKSAPTALHSGAVLGTLVESLAKTQEVNDSLIREQTLKTYETIRTRNLKEIVSQAIKDHKVFCIFDNHWYIVRPVREELLSRGWLEVIPDKRLIPRRKPPPAGPAVDRRNSTDYTIEAILTAKEAAADDLTELMKHPPAKIPLDSSKAAKKCSDDSLRETYSEFRIVPPSPEIKRKNNMEIRQFVTNFENERQLSKPGTNKIKDKKLKRDPSKTKPSPPLSPMDDPKGKLRLSRSVQDIIASINENWKNLTENKEEKPKKDSKQEEVFAEVSGKKEEPAESVESNAPSGTLALIEADAKAASKMLQSANAKINFMWLSIKPGIHLKCFNYSPEILNKFQKTSFCTKIGLWSHLNNIQWYAHEVAFPAKSPRMYNTGEADDLQAFEQDFQMTACIGILKWLSETFFEKGIRGVQKKKGKVPIKAIEFAIRQCEKYIRFKENDDLNALEEPKTLPEEWNTFLQWYYAITNDHGKLQETSNAQLMVVYTKAVEILRVMRRYWPEIDVDGRLNIWIMKPYCASCGRGIFMTNNIYYIGQHSKYIVQKYIEKPFLIYNTKFDIRQWFMITKLIPLEIWMYKECYLRFCTQPFALRNLHESVHLSNNSVQRKYTSQKDPSLPDQNMWDSKTFQQYLRTIGQPQAWNEIIYPGMRDAIISIMLASQDTFDCQRKSWFEVYGADFMISANLRDGPWLIEINENPAMDPSTKVTARLCPQMLRDVIKVVVDKRVNRNALTGQWELVYRQNYSPSFGTVDIDIKGRKIARITPTLKTHFNSVPSQVSDPSSVVSTSRGTEDKNQEMTKNYEIVKGYCNVKKNSEVHLSPWKAHGRPKLMKETINVENPQV